MPHHIHTSPQCGFWTGHDPSCFNQGLGAEKDCILIEVGINKGKYVCIHERPAETGSGHSGFHEAPERIQVGAAGGCRIGEFSFQQGLTAELAQEYGAIHQVLRPGVLGLADTITAINDAVTKTE
jgi:hypothetical protein